MANPRPILAPLGPCQVTKELESYQALGPGFKSLAREYGLIKQQLTETKGMLAKFDDLKSELADHWSG